MQGLKLLRVRNSSEFVTVFTTPLPPVTLDPEQTRLDQIRKRKVLRGCYTPVYPLAYFNNRTPPELVGFNIEMAHILAQDLGLRLELFPIEEDQFDSNISQEARLLNQGYCDIVIDSLQVSPELASQLNFTLAFDNYTVAFLVKDKFREQFSNWQNLRELSPLKIGITTDNNYYRAKLKGLLPNANLIEVQSYDELLQNENLNIDTIVTAAETGAAWTILNPDYAIAIPQPIIAIPIAYGLPYEEQTWLNVINAWLKLKQQDGTIAPPKGYCDHS